VKYEGYRAGAERIKNYGNLGAEIFAGTSLRLPGGAGKDKFKQMNVPEYSFSHWVEFWGICGAHGAGSERCADIALSGNDRIEAK